MAASMIRGRLSCQTNYFIHQCVRNSSGNGYYVLLPEVPPDTPETNPIMRHDSYPEFSKISPDLIISGCAKLALQYDVKLGQHIEKLKDPDCPKDFDTVFKPIEELAVPLNYAWNTAKTLNYVSNTEGRQKAFHRVHRQIGRVKNERWISDTLHKSVKDVKTSHSSLTEFQSRLVDMYLHEGYMDGIELASKDKERFTELLKRVTDHKHHFRNRVMLSHNMFSHTLHDIDDVIELPRSLSVMMAADKNNPGRGPWNVTLDQNIYTPFMEHCSHRLLRWNIWQAYNNRAALDKIDQNLSNHNTIKELRLARKDIADCLGHKNYAHLSMEGRMAGNVENVLNLIESLRTKLRSNADDEIASVQEFAQTEGFTGRLESWDLPYWRRRQRDDLYFCDGDKIAEYFPLNKTLENIFGLCKELFGVEFKDCTGDVDTWHEDVLFYRLYDVESQQQMAGFYLDLYSRPDKLSATWVESGRERSNQMGTQPFSYMNLDLEPAIPGQPKLLTPENVDSVFQELGNVLQQLLTVVPYSEISGQNNIEWDSLQTCSNVFLLIGNHPHILQRISSHHSTGESLPEELITNMLAAKNHLRSYDLMHHLYLSAYDMEMYMSDKPWHGTMESLYPLFNPLPLSEEDYHPCSLTAIFSDQYPASLYTVIWSQMLAKDIFKSFQQAGLDNPERVIPIGKRFRDTYLSLGGGISASEVFRRFQGRDPSQDAIIESYQQ